MKSDIPFTNQFKKDLKLAKKQNKNLDKLFEVIDILANGGTLDAKYRDHDLTGNYKGTRECHIEPDWLLIYEIQNNVLVLRGRSSKRKNISKSCKRRPISLPLLCRRLLLLVKT